MKEETGCELNGLATVVTSSEQKAFSRGKVPVVPVVPVRVRVRVRLWPLMKANAI